MILTLDFGGTKLTAALVAAINLEQPHWLAYRRLFSPPGAVAQDDLAAMTALGDELCAGRALTAVGVSFGGPVDFERGLVRLSHHVPGWEMVPLAARLEAHFQAPVAVDNDANAAALGEAYLGAGRGQGDLLYVTVSTGVGGGWILNGRPWRGAGGLAGEIGHTVVDPAGPRCLCGKRGCVERLASGPYMAADARHKLAEQPQQGVILRGLVRGEVAQVTGERLAEAAALGDELARDLLVRGGRALGVGLGNALNLVNPALVILGGGVSKAGELWWTAVRQAARATALPEIDVQIVPAALGDDAPLWGAALLADPDLPPF